MCPFDVITDIANVAHFVKFHTFDNIFILTQVSRGTR